MRKVFVGSCMFIIAAAAVADLAPQVVWDIECQKPAPYALQLTAGESMDWVARYKIQERPLSLTNATRVAFLFRTSGTTNVPYELPGYVANATNGKIRITWPSSNVVAAGQYDYRILVAGVSKANMRGYGTLTVDAGFGTTTGSAPPYVQLITSNMIAGMIAQSWNPDTVTGAVVRVEADPVALPIAIAASNLASTALQPISTNNFLSTMPALQDVLTQSAIASNENLALIDYVNGRAVGINRTHPNITGSGIYGQYSLSFRLGMADSDGRTLLEVSTSTLGPGSGVGADTDVLYGNGRGWHPVNDLTAVKIADTNGWETGPHLKSAAWRNPDWFQLSWIENPTNVPDSISYRTNLDQIIEHHGFNNTRYDRVAQISEQHSFFDLAFHVVPTNYASVSSNGYLTHLADGVVTASVTAATFGRTNTLFMRTEGMAIDRYWGASAGSLRSAIISNVAANVTNTSTATFSTYTPPAFIRNTNLWVNPAPVCIAAWNSRSGHLGGGILITPKHAITAIHASFRPQVGDVVKYVDETNGVWITSVAAEVNVAADIGLIRFTTNVPVRVAKFLADPAGTLPTGIRELPLALGEVHFGTHEFQLVVGGSESWGQRGFNGISWWKAAEQTFWRALFKHFPVVGDSSQPVLFSTGRDFVALFALLSPTTGPNLHSYLPEIQATISGWGDTNTISYLDVTPYTEY
jgi:hypothetical protein